MQRVIGSDPESGSPLKPTAPKQNGSAFRTDPFKFLAEWTGLEPATPGVTGRYSNRLNYHSASVAGFSHRCDKHRQTWRPLGDSNPCYNRERVVS